MESEQGVHLPPELLSIISGFLQDAADIIRFRSVCRSWRLSTPMLHKISPFFPLLLPADVYTTSGILTEIKIQASALYLLRSRRDPSKAWVVHAEEYAPGKLLFRHAMNLKEIPVANWPDLSSDEWSSVTQIARTYIAECQGVSPKVKFAQIISKSPGFNILVRSSDPCYSWSSFFAHVSGSKSTNATVGEWFSSFGRVGDFVLFNGQMYAVEDNAALYVLDRTTSTPEFIQLIPGRTIGAPFGEPCWEIRKRLAVLDEHLYLVLSKDTRHDPSFEFLECYILVVEGECEARWERVEDLGGGVLFINQHYTFAVSAKDLPPPWRGNSIVYLCYPSVGCSCPSSKWWGIRVFQLGVEGAKFTANPPFSSFQCYPDLFDPPLL